MNRDSCGTAFMGLKASQKTLFRISVYQKHLDELEIDIELGDYIGYYETETQVRYYVVNNDGRVVSDNKHTY